MATDTVIQVCSYGAAWEKEKAGEHAGNLEVRKWGQMLKGEDQDRFYSMTQWFPGENISQFESQLFFPVLLLKKVSFLHCK